MRVNEEKVQGVSDTLSPVVKSQLKRKQLITEVLNDVSACFSEYKPLSIPSQSSKPYISAMINTSEAFFELFITFTHFQLIANYTNINSECKRATETDEEKEEAKP